MASLRRAQRKYVPFKASIQGASGSGKTYSALNILTPLVAITSPGKRIAVIDTEKSAELYSPPFEFDVDDDFGEGPKLSFSYKKLIEKLENIRKTGEYGGVVVDSMTHFWKEVGGFTRMIDAICDKQRARPGGRADSFSAWKEIDPLYRELMTYIRQYPLHIIMCVRAKQGYEDQVDQNGRKKKVKVGMEPEFREGFEYEMDAQFAIDFNHVMVPLKHRLGDVFEKSFPNPGADVAGVVAEWLAGGAHVASPVQASPSAAPEPPPSDTVAINHAVRLSSLILETNDIDVLRGAVRVEIKKTLDDKLITLDEYKAISAAWAAKGKALAAASAPAPEPAPEAEVPATAEAS